MIFSPEETMESRFAARQFCGKERESARRLRFCSASCEEHGSHIEICAQSSFAFVTYPDELNGLDVICGRDETGTHWAIFQTCRGCGTLFPYDPDADYCPACVAINIGEVAGQRER